MSIAVEHVTKRYEGNPVVNDVSLEIAENELFVLLGPSGSGKSTLLRMIAGLAGVDAGRIHLHGRDVTDLSARERGVGFVFQHYALFKHLTVAQNVEFALSVRKVTRAERARRRDELLGLVGLTGFGGRRPGQLSGGQQQRVALARALAHNPAVLLLDEPFGALDAKIRVDLRRTIREIQRAVGITAVFVTHDQEEAFEVGDRIAVLHHGRLLEVGRPDDLYLRPRTRFVATFLGAGNLMVGRTAPEGVRLGPVALPLSTRGSPEPAPRRVQVLFRPEDVELAPAEAELRSPALGVGTVESVTFSGALERVRVRLPRLPGARAVTPALPYGADHLLVDTSRASFEALRFPLRAGDRAAVGVRRVHPLERRRLALLLLDDGTPEGAAARGVGEAMVAQADARLLGLGAPEAQPLAPSPAVEFVRSTAPAPCAAGQASERARFDVAVIGLPPRNVADLAEGVLAAGDHHLLLVPKGGGLPGRMLVCTAAGEPGKRLVQFAGRFAQDLGASATVLTVVAAGEDRRPAEAFLERSVRVLSGWGVEAQPLIRQGLVPREVLDELATGGYDLLVLGAPFSAANPGPRITGLAARVLFEARSHTVLVVRSTEELE